MLAYETAVTVSLPSCTTMNAVPGKFGYCKGGVSHRRVAVTVVRYSLMQVNLSVGCKEAKLHRRLACR